ncbi:DUF2273 domain-containing protein [Desulfosporosinus fructosivorans]|uniref:DUF2273 domain-containing protein n=1 Tax=Desulfosporosinus fructosivorans TaxID=2018669 RepID=A0A4Z0R729_9FIRM|nr:DUF2273 domain-containing protein [Desulfosporosinus fructosivorans]TGE37807.1 DUF2273 domain-containing protein [Desulfosporosinus fructosivorans]
MSEFWSKTGEIITKFLVWAIENHPGKLIGTSLGFVLGLLMVTLGFWRTVILALFAILGFVLGKRQDDNKIITTWLEKNFRKY